MSTPVAARASPWPTGRRCTHASIPALHAEYAASVIRKPFCSGLGCSSPWLSASSAIAGRRSQATARSASAVAWLGKAGTVELEGEGSPRVIRRDAVLVRLFDQAAAHRARHGRRTVGHAELLVQVLHVRLHRREPEEELLRDLREALAARDQVQDLLLARRQRRRVVLLAEPDLRDQARGDV